MSPSPSMPRRSVRLEKRERPGSWENSLACPCDNYSPPNLVRITAIKSAGGSMPTRVRFSNALGRCLSIGFAAAFAAPTLLAQTAESTPSRSAIERMQKPSGLIAERTMVGLFLQEVMKPAPGSTTPDFRRISYLHYNRVEGRWKYVSLDTRFPAGIMPAWSFENEVGGKLTLQFEGLAFAGWGREVEGWLMRSNYVITRENDDHEFARQFWTRADGTGREWLAVEYEYTRKR